jgi:hypothetical protein
MRMLKRKTCVVVMALGILIPVSAGLLLALNDDYNRPNPIMDYAPQEIGVYDTRYDELSEADCRGCHGESLADRHHHTSYVLEDDLCSPCHEMISAPPGVVIIRDCTTPGCHSWDDVYANGWHHDTDLYQPGNCVSCHDSNLVGQIGSFGVPFGQIGSFVPFWWLPPSITPPTPFSCENCHWEQDEVASAPDFVPLTSPQSEAGHPSTYDHYDVSGQFIGYYEYGKPVLGNHDTHHMGFKGYITYECYKCHSNDPNDSSWDPYNPELIRCCEVCHDLATLHNIEGHVGPGGLENPIAGSGWIATGFHVLWPTQSSYRPFYTSEVCLGCHGETLPTSWEVPNNPNIRIRPQGIEPKSICGNSSVALNGKNFGDYRPSRCAVEIENGTEWIELPIQSWSDDSIVFTIPCGTISVGNHHVRVRNDEASVSESNQVSLTLKDCGPCYVFPDQGPCDPGVISLIDSSGLYGTGRDTISAPGASDGTFRIVEVSSTQGNFIARVYPSWTSDEVRFRFKDFFQDQDEDFLQDGDELTISSCEGLDRTTWSVYVAFISYSDVDATGTFTEGDTISDVATRLEGKFDLTNDCYIRKLKYRSIERGKRLKIVGAHFGNAQTDGEVRIGKASDYYDPDLGKGHLLDRIKNWTDTRIVVRLKVPAKWEGKKRFVWIEKDGMKSNYKKVEILAPLP